MVKSLNERLGQRLLLRGPLAFAQRDEGLLRVGVGCGFSLVEVLDPSGVGVPAGFGMLAVTAADVRAAATANARAGASGGLRK